MNGSNFGRIPALLIWSNMWKKSSRILAKNIKLILYRHLSAFSVHQHQESRHDLMLSLWPYAPHCAQLCIVPAHTLSPMVKEKAGTERAQTRSAFPGLG